MFTVAMHSVCLAAVAAAALLALASPAHAARPLTIGFDDPYFNSADGATRATWLDRAKGVGARMVRLTVDWRSIAPATRPAGFQPADPADPAYSFAGLDVAVRDARARGFVVLLNVAAAPDWAEGPGRRPDAPAGTWRPSAAEYGRFATALASRYSGSFADPGQPGSTLPRVRHYQAWNEPTLPNYLNPQWQGRRAVSPAIYRRLLNAFYGAVKGVRRSNVVVTAGTAPYGDPGHRGRMRPVRFLRGLFCLRGRALRPVKCPERPAFDVLAHHPINVYRPRRGAAHPDDVSTPDIGRIRRVLRKAQRTGRIRPRGAKPIWVTELWYDTRPPDPRGISLGRQARFYAETLYLLWRQGVRVALLLQVGDSPPVPNYKESSQSGIYFRDGMPKPSRRGIRFPFVAERRGPATVRVWGIAPLSGKVRIQRAARGGWKTIRTLRQHGRGPFLTRLRLRGAARLRAVAGSGASLVWRLR